MSAALHLGPGLSLPLDAVTQTFGILGKRGVGKSATAGVIAEELLEHGLQVVVLDPVGVWWGLRSSADGKGKGYPVLILGGDHGDLPLEAAAGKLVADFVIAKRASVVIDLGAFSKTDQCRFVADFLERLYQKNRAPLQLIIDEADAFAPQRLHPGVQRCFGAVDTAVRRGRARGLGVTLVTQRSAALNKDVLTQIEVLIVFRTIAPQDRAAIEAWVQVHGDQEKARQLLQSLHELKVGECWIWSPAWLDRMSRVLIRRRRTFDSSATPEAGKVVRAPKAIAEVDVEVFRTELASLVQRADEEDPRRLRARLAQLERELKAKPAAAPAPKPEVVKTAVIEERDLRRIEKAAEAASKLAEVMRDVLARVSAPSINYVLNPRAAISVTSERPTASIVAAHVSARAPQPHAGNGSGGDAAVGSGGLRRMLIALAQRPKGLNHRQLGLRAGLSSRSGTFSTYLGRARGSGWIEGRGDVRITEVGLAALGSYQPLPEGRELLEYWIGELGQSGAARMLRALAEVFPRTLTNAQLGEAAAVASGSGTFSTYLGRLRGLELVEGRGELRASEELFG